MNSVILSRKDSLLYVLLNNDKDVLITDINTNTLIYVFKSILYAGKDLKDYISMFDSEILANFKLICEEYIENVISKSGNLELYGIFIDFYDLIKKYLPNSGYKIIKSYTRSDINNICKELIDIFVS